MMDEVNLMDNLAWARRVWQNIPYNARYSTHKAVTSVQRIPPSNICEISTWPERIEFVECTKCGCNTYSGTPGWYRCRLCGAPAFRRVQLRGGCTYSWPWPPDDPQTATKRS